MADYNPPLFAGIKCNFGEASALLDKSFAEMRTNREN